MRGINLANTVLDVFYDKLKEIPLLVFWKTRGGHFDFCQIIRGSSRAPKSANRCHSQSTNQQKKNITEENKT